MSSITYCTFQQEKKPILHTQPYACHHGLIQNDDLDNLVPLFITYVSREISSSMNSNEKKSVWTLTFSLAAAGGARLYG